MLEATIDDLCARRTLHAAFERVRGHGGCRGADGITLGRFAERLEQELDHLEDRLRSRRYHPYPLLRFPIPKPRNGIRYLAVPTVRDRVAQTAAYLVTKDRFESEFEQCSYAFRPGRSVKSAIHRVDELRQAGYRFLVDADIEDFFGQIAHDRLLGRLRKLHLEDSLFALFRRSTRVSKVLKDFGARVHSRSSSAGSTPGPHSGAVLRGTARQRLQPGPPVEVLGRAAHSIHTADKAHTPRDCLPPLPSMSTRHTPAHDGRGAGVRPWR